MTVLVGIRCKDGVVIASDSAATFGAGGRPTIGQQTVQKVVQINNSIVFAATGAVGMAQLVIDSISAGWSQGTFKGMDTPEKMMNAIGIRIGQLVRPYLETAQMQRAVTGDASTSLCKSLIAMPVKRKFCLFQFDFNGAPENATSQLPFVALGSGQAIADPFLALLKRLLWPDCEPTLAEGRLAAVWAIDHVRRTNAGGVGGEIQLATLSQENGEQEPTVHMVAKVDVEEHMQAVADAEAALVRQIKGEGVAPAGGQTPEPPLEITK